LGVRRAVVAAETARDVHEGQHPVGPCERDIERELAAHREPDERSAVDSERVEDAHDVLLPRPRGRRPRRAPEEPEVGPDGAEPLGEERDDRLPKARIAEAAVQEQDGRAAAGFVVPEARALHVDRRHAATLASAPWTFHTSSSWVRARWAAGSPRWWPRPVGGSRCTMPSPERTSADSRRCGAAWR